MEAMLEEFLENYLLVEILESLLKQSIKEFSKGICESLSESYSWYLSKGIHGLRRNSREVPKIYSGVIIRKFKKVLKKTLNVLKNSCKEISEGS